MNDDDYLRSVRLNLPHARTVAQRVGRSLEALGAFGEASNGHAAPLAAAFDALEQRLRGYDEDPPAGEALRRPTRRRPSPASWSRRSSGRRPGATASARTSANLFECLGLADEGARLALLCGERPDSPLR